MPCPQGPVGHQRPCVASIFARTNSLFWHHPLSTITPTAGRKDDDAVASGEMRCLPRSKGHLPRLSCDWILPNPDVLPPLAVLSSLEPVWSSHTPIGENGHLQWHSELHLSHTSISTSIQTVTAAALTDGEAMQDNGIPLLENFRVSDACVRHVCVHGTGSVPSWTGSRAATDGLVIPKATDNLTCGRVGAATSKAEIVHRALGGGSGVESAKDQVSDLLGGLGRAADSRGRG